MAGDREVPAVSDPKLSWTAKGLYVAIAWMDAAITAGHMKPPVGLGTWTSSSNQETELGCQELERWGYLTRHANGAFDLHWKPHALPPEPVDLRDAEERTMHTINRLGRSVSVEQVPDLCLGTGLSYDDQHAALLRLEESGRLVLRRGWWRAPGAL